MVKTPLDEGIRDHVPVGFFAAKQVKYRGRDNACQGRRREEIWFIRLMSTFVKRDEMEVLRLLFH
jgi:hypothetical protein